MENKKIDAILIDLDLTIADNSNRGSYDFSSNILQDPPIPIMIEVVKSILEKTGAYPLFLTGRNESGRQWTEQWLQEYFDFPYTLFLKSTSYGPGRTARFKKSVYDTEIKDFYNVLLSLDDDDRNIKIFKDELICLQVHYKERKVDE